MGKLGMEEAVDQTTVREPGVHRTPGREDAAVCREIVAAHARTFMMASRLLPAHKRRGIYAVYATCRTADDIVDLAQPGHEAEARARLDLFAARVRGALRGASSEPILRELARAVDTFAIPTSALDEVLDAVGRDALPRRFATWTDVEEYCEGVAGSVGEMSCAVFGVGAGHDRATVVREARRLGVAMQLTNILRDVGEDARRGRCYLPEDELAAHGLSTDMVLHGDVRAHWIGWRAFMGAQVRRARELYRRATSAIDALQPDARRCALASAAGYAEILSAIERHDYDSFTSRASTSGFDKLRIAWQSMLLMPPSFGGARPRGFATRAAQ